MKESWFSKLVLNSWQSSKMFKKLWVRFFLKDTGNLFTVDYYYFCPCLDPDTPPSWCCLGLTWCCPDDNTTLLWTFQTLCTSSTLNPSSCVLSAHCVSVATQLGSRGFPPAHRQVCLITATPTGLTSRAHTHHHAERAAPHAVLLSTVAVWSTFTGCNGMQWSALLRGGSKVCGDGGRGATQQLWCRLLSQSRHKICL